jgi:pentatricopeptide repeat protein
MENQGLKLNCYAFCAVMHVFARAGDVSQTQRWFYEMKAKGIEPNVRSYTILIDACARHKPPDIEKAEWVLQEMQKSNFPLDQKAYKTLFKLYVNVPDVDGAVRVCKEMEQNSIQMMPDMYASLISACAEVADGNRALEFLREMEKRRMKLNVITYTSAINAYCKSRDLAGADRLVAEMSNKGIRPNAITYMTLLRGCEMQNDPVRAMMTFKAVKDDARVTLDAEILRPILRILKRCVCP